MTSSTEVIAETTFEQMVARYERSGWTVRTINRATQRATVRTGTIDSQAVPDESRVKPPDRVPACRKLWVDGHGNAQETNVPC